MPQSAFTSIPTYLERMILQTQLSGAQITDFNIGSVSRTLYEALGAALSYQSLVADQLNLDGYLDSATGPALDDQAANFGVTRLPAVQASGMIQISRQSTDTALSIPAGWSQLSTVPTPGGDGVALVSTQDAVFDIGVASVSVSAQAIVGGVGGNLAANVILLPTAPVNGVQSDGGILTQGAWGGGVDVESDDALRARVPIEVQGRVKGTAAALQAAALSVPGSLGVKVAQAGDTLGDLTLVPAGSVYVYYRGSSGLQGAVQSALDAAKVLNQNAVAYASVLLQLGFVLPATFPASDGLVFADRGQMEVIASLTVYVNPGSDHSLVAQAVSDTVMGYFALLSVGQVAHLSRVVNLLHALPQVVSVGLPMSDFRLRSAVAGTASDITPLPDSYLNLTGSNLIVAIVELT